MEFFVARAMQIACLNSEQIEALHKKEVSVEYCLANWNIQRLLGMKGILDYLGIPENDEGAQGRHRKRIEDRIYKLGLLKKIEAEGIVSPTNVEATHAFDYAVFNNLPEIDFPYQRGRGKKGLEEEVLASVLGAMAFLGGIA